MDVRHIAFLRAVNVGGHAVVRMAEVRQAFTTAGCRNVRTFIQSGNVVFDASSRGTAALFDRIRVAMCELLGLDAAMSFRTLEDVDRLIASNPFGAMTADPALKLYVAFFEGVLAPAPKLPLAVPREEVEIIAIRDGAMFIVTRRKPNGMYGFPNAVVEKLGVVATSRNWTTVTKIAAFARRD